MESDEETSAGRGIPLGHALTDASDAKALIGLSVVIVPLIVIAVWVGIAFSLFGGLVIGAIGLVLSAFVVRSLRSVASWANPQLFLPSNDPLRLGDHVVVRFRRRARARVDPSGAVVTAQLMCIERVRYQVGSDTQTATQEVHRQDVGVVLQTVSGLVVEADLGIDVPLAAPPSIDLANNDILWTLEVEITAPNAADDTATFPIVIAPAVSSRALEVGQP